MNFDIKTKGYNHKFKKDSNELIIECYDYKDYHVGNISIIMNKEEQKELLDLLKNKKF